MTAEKKGNLRERGSTLTTVLAILLFGGMLGVLLLLLFGNRNPGADTVSATMPGVPGTTLSRPAAATPADTSGASASNASGTASTSSAPASGTSDNNASTAATTASGAPATAATHTPVEGEAASGSPGQQQAVPAATQGGTQSDLELEQTVTDHDFKGTGKEIYVQACQACHMPGGVGAKGGAGMYNYPALAGNPKLKTAQYPMTMVLYGNGGMPSFGHYMSDEQISEVVNYIRTELNKNTDKIKPADVKQMRQPGQHYMIFGEAAG